MTDVRLGCCAGRGIVGVSHGSTRVTIRERKGHNMAQTMAVKVRTRLIGTTQYAQHNVQLADPDNHWAREIAAITKKRTKTEEDRQAIQRLEFLGGLYVHED